MDNIPWVEKYRPTIIDDIILDNNNKLIFENIINNNVFPNLLLYGPPGTGKTTTIINIINTYNKDKINNKSLVIHLNASDDRGIDIIRNQIYQFSITKSLFSNGCKFVILDEIDYMTTSAQQALKYLIQSTNNIVFCLICNYISKIDNSIKNECIHFKFNKLPNDKIITFLNKINKLENLELTNDNLIYIQHKFNSDIRSMINYMQSNQYNFNHYSILHTNIYDNIFDIIDNNYNNNDNNDNNDNVESFNIINIIKKNNINLKTFIINFFIFIVQNKTYIITNDFIKQFEFIVHLDESYYYDNLLKLFIHKLKLYL
jgi:replication factor C subunit 3/5